MHRRTFDSESRASRGFYSSKLTPESYSIWGNCTNVVMIPDPEAEPARHRIDATFFYEFIKEQIRNYRRVPEPYATTFDALE